MNHHFPLIYQHVQSEPATTWTLVHNLRRRPVVDVYIMIGGVETQIIPKSINYVDDNTSTIVFSAAQTGFATVM